MWRNRPTLLRFLVVHLHLALGESASLTSMKRKRKSTLGSLNMLCQGRLRTHHCVLWPRKSISSLSGQGRSHRNFGLSQVKFVGSHKIIYLKNWMLETGVHLSLPSIRMWLCGQSLHLWPHQNQHEIYEIIKWNLGLSHHDNRISYTFLRGEKIQKFLSEL